MSDLLKVKIFSPEKLVFEGSAKSVSSQNSSGVFDILPKHANFITIIENKPIQVRTEGKNTEFTFSKSILYVHQDAVSIYSAQ